jgi:hypothetical protein
MKIQVVFCCCCGTGRRTIIGMRKEYGRKKIKR